MAPELLEEMMNRAADKAIARYAAAYPCRLSEAERSMIHAQHEAMVEEGGNNGTWRVVIQWGVNLTDVTKQCRKVVIWSLAVIAGLVAYKIFWK